MHESLIEKQNGNFANTVLPAVVGSKKYSIIYCDPPWFRGQRMMSSNKNDRHVEASRHYPVMKKDELCKLPIKQLADKDCAMFMWVTDSNLDEAMEVMKAWGFKYKTVAFIWNKKEKSGKQVCFMGCWTMKNCELVLLGTKGAMTKHLKSRKVRQLQDAIRERNIHSRKPQLIRDKIVEMFGNELPKIELFARVKTDGWDIWGNELDNDVELETSANNGR